MLKKLKNIFIVEDENESSSKSEKEVKKAEAAEEAQVIKNVPTDTVVEINLEQPKDLKGKPDPKFIDILLKAIEKNNLEGFDYLEYKQSLQSLNNMDMDEATKYKSAFAMAKTMGATGPKLIQSADHYVKILNAEEKKFKEALINQRNKQVKGREESLKKLELSISQKTQQIEKLKKEIADTESKLENVRKQINQSAAKVENTNNKFHLAFKIVMGQILEDINKMKTHLK